MNNYNNSLKTEKRSILEYIFGFRNKLFRPETMSSNPNDRKAELERKKAKLAQIREEKRRMEEERRRALLNDGGKADDGASSEST